MKNQISMVVLVAVLGGTGCSKGNVSAGGGLKVTADATGFTPSSLALAKGQPATIEFTRTTDNKCAREVVFPGLDVKKDLPLNTPVAISVPASEAKTYTFQCAFWLLRGSARNPERRRYL